jgi:hypothetical protein
VDVLLHGSNIYNEVAAMFFETLKMSNGVEASMSGYKLVCIQHLQNFDRWTEYLSRKRTFLRSVKNGKMAHINEKWLWHGTPFSNLDSVITNGLLRDYCGRAAYGRGTYYAVNAEYSWHNAYSQPQVIGSHSYKAMILSRVLVGDSCYGHSGKDRPDKFPKDHPRVGEYYDSFYGCCRTGAGDKATETDKDIYVLSTGSDCQAYAEFVLYFKC